MPPLKDYLSPNADGLADKVDFTKMIGDFGRAGVTALFAAVAGFILSVKTSFDKLVGALVSSQERSIFALTQSIDDTTESATNAAMGEVVEFGFFALPAGVVVTLSAIVGVAFVIAIFWGDVV